MLNVDHCISIFLHLQQQVEEKEQKLQQSAFSGVSTASLAPAPDTQQQPERPTRGSNLAYGDSNPSKTSYFHQWVEAGFYASFRKGASSAPDAFPADFLMLPSAGTPQQQSQLHEPSHDEQIRNPDFHIDDPRSVGPLDDVRSIPVHVARRLFGEYVKLTLPIWPAFLADELWSLFDDVFQNPSYQTEQEDQFALYVVAMILAISIVSNKTYYPPKAYPAGLKLYKYALDTQHDFTVPSIRNIQRLILLSQFCYIVPSAGHAGPLSSVTMRMALDLKLHLNSIPRSRSSDPFASQDCSGTVSRKLLFWTVYIVERSVAFTLHRRLGIADEFICVRDIGEEDLVASSTHRHGHDGDSADNDNAQVGAQHAARSGPVATEFVRIIRLRKIESEIFQVRFMGRKRDHTGSVDDWIANMEHKAWEWLREVSTSQDGGHQERDDGHASIDCSNAEPGWAFVGYYQALLLLYRPCPIDPEPTQDTLIKSFDAAQKMGETTFEYMRKGRLRLPWHGTNQTVQASLVLLFALQRARSRLVEEKGIAEILQSVALFSTLFTFLSQSWSEAVNFGTLYEKLQRQVVDEVLRPWDQANIRLHSPGATGELLDELIHPQRVHGAVGSPNYQEQSETTRQSASTESRIEGQTQAQAFGTIVDLSDQGTAQPGEEEADVMLGHPRFSISENPAQPSASSRDMHRSRRSLRPKWSAQHSSTHLHQPLHHHTASQSAVVVPTNSSEHFSQQPNHDAHQETIGASTSLPNVSSHLHSTLSSQSYATHDPMDNGRSMLPPAEQSLAGSVLGDLPTDEHARALRSPWTAEAYTSMADVATVNSLSVSYISAQEQTMEQDNGDLIGGNVANIEPSASNGNWDWTNELLDGMFGSTSHMLDSEFELDSGMWLI